MFKEGKTDKTYSFIIDEADRDRRIDAVLADLMEDISRSSIQKLIEEGSVFVNGDPVKIKKRKLKEGDLIKIALREEGQFFVEPENISLDIIYEDEDLMVVDKPAGMVVHPAIGNLKGTLVNAISFHCKGRLSRINGDIRQGIVHRLDKDTSGLLVIAKTDTAHAALACQFASRSVKRIYKGIVYGYPKNERGTVDAAIGRDYKNRLRMAVVESGGRAAVTHYRVLENLREFSFVEAELVTGRTHQIRVHMAYIGHPLLGDTLYGPKKQRFDVKRQMLHAVTLGFIHPSTGQYMQFDSPLPGVLNNLLKRLKQ